MSKLTPAEYAKTAAAKRGVPYAKYEPWFQTQQANAAAAAEARRNDPVRQAGQMATAALAPELAALLAAQKNTNQQYAGSANTLEAAYKALAELQKGEAPAVKDTYEDAAGSTAAFAKGFSSAFQAASEGSARDINEFLGKQGSPQQVQGAGAAGADVLFGLGGFIPASTMAREGAAFTAAAQARPGNTAGLGLDALKGLEAQRLSAVKELGTQRQAIQAKRPALVNQFLNQIQESRRADRALDINEAYLGNTMRNTGAQITGYDPVTGQPTYETVVATAEANDAKTAAKTKAVNAKNNATVTALDEATTLVENAVYKGGTEPKKIGETASTGPSITIKGLGTVPQYWTKDGKLTRNINDPNIMMVPVYEQVPLPKPQYDRLFKQVYGKLRRTLKRYGYKDKVLKSMADDLLADYYTVVGGQAENPTVPDRTGPPPDKR